MRDIVNHAEALVAALYANNHDEVAGILDEAKDTLLRMLDEIAAAGLIDDETMALVMA